MKFQRTRLFLSLRILPLSFTPPLRNPTKFLGLNSSQRELSLCKSEHLREAAVCDLRPLLAISRKDKMPGSGEQALGNREVLRPGDRRARVSGGILFLLLTPVLPTTSLALALGPSTPARRGACELSLLLL